MASVTTDQFFPSVVLSIMDSLGRPAPVDGIPVWASSDDTVLAITPAADGMSAVVDTVAPGTARITISADADMGAGVVPITGVSEDVDVTPGNVAAVMSISLGTVADKVPSP